MFSGGRGARVEGLTVGVGRKEEEKRGKGQKEGEMIGEKERI